MQLRPFDVTNVTAEARWDPTDHKLPVGYDINDRNGRIRRGRIRYMARGPTGDDVAVFIQPLTREQLRHGRCYEVPEARRWDGTIREGLTDRVGQKVTAEDSPLAVFVEAWNTDNAEPAPRVRQGRGRTEREGEWVASGVATVEIDAIVEAKWDRKWVIPYDDPDEPTKGEAKMRIEVRNVREGAAVRIEVFRIGTIADSTTDFPYVDTGWGPDDQPGLQELTVQNGRVRRPDGSEPVVRFSNYEEHWKHPGNNFYAFSVAFGEHGLAMVASQRDYVNHEDDCLHMRFTVFIHCSSLGDEYKTCADRLFRFLSRDTKYYRPYKLNGNPRNPADWIKRFQHRYIVAVQGHGTCGCKHNDHPKRRVGRGRTAREEPMDPHHWGFDPDRFVCPTGIEDTNLARRQLRFGRRHYRREFGGCGNASHFYSAVSMGTMRSNRRKAFLLNLPGAPATSEPVLFLAKRRATDADERYRMGHDEIPPRLLLYAGGCRGMLCKNLGQTFTGNGTKHFHGWVYSVWIRENLHFCLDFFRLWIKGTRQEPAPSEFDLARFVDCYRRTTRNTYGDVSWHSHPRLMEGRNVLNTRAAPDRAARTLR